jgi:hypothetical protein
MINLNSESDKTLARNIILNEAVKHNEIIHGMTAVNKQLPDRLKRETKDIDVLTRNPKKRAEEIKNELNRRYGKNIYKVTEGKHKGTYKIQDQNNETLADYTGKIGHKPNTVNILGNRFIRLDSAKSKIKQILKNEANEFRFDKDKDTLRRIKEAEHNNWLRR